MKSWAELPMRPVRVTGPAIDVITATEVKTWARIDGTDDDTLVEALIDAAISHVDGYSGILGRCMISQTWRKDFRYWKPYFYLPFPDVTAIASVKYFDKDNVEQTVSASLYQLIESDNEALVRFSDDFSEPGLYDDRLDAIKVQFVAGYGASASDVPEAIRTAIKMICAQWYENREASSPQSFQELPNGAQALLRPYRRIGF